MNDAAARAREYFTSHNCAQATARAILEERGLYRDDYTALLAGFGEGMVGKGMMCGAVTGAVAAIGIIVSQTEKDVVAHKRKVLRIAQWFIDEFTRRRGSVVCSVLLGKDRENSTTPGTTGRERAIKYSCSDLVATGVELALRVADQHGDSRTLLSGPPE